MVDFFPFCFQRDVSELKHWIAEKDRRSRSSEFNVEFRREEGGFIRNRRVENWAGWKAKVPFTLDPDSASEFPPVLRAICINKKKKRERDKEEGKREERGEKCSYGRDKRSSLSLSLFFFSLSPLLYLPVFSRKKLAVPLVVATSLFTFCSVCGENENRFFFFLEREKGKNTPVLWREKKKEGKK